MYTLAVFEENPRKGWHELRETHLSLPKAVEKAAELWEDDDYYYTAIRIKETKTLCTLIRPGHEPVLQGVEDSDR